MMSMSIQSKKDASIFHFGYIVINEHIENLCRESSFAVLKNCESTC